MLFGVFSEWKNRTFLISPQIGPLQVFSKSGTKVRKIFDICKFICKNRPFQAGIGRNRDEGGANGRT